MTRRAFSLVELLVAQLLLAIGVLGVVGVLHRSARAERTRLDARRQRALESSAHERAAAATPRWRAGVSLPELLVVLAIGGLVATVAIAGLGGSAGRARTLGADQRARRQRLETAADLLARELREGRAASLSGDTVLRLERIVGVGRGCGLGVVAPVEPLAWSMPPRPGDAWRVWRDGAWQVGVGGATSAERCPDGRAGWRAEASPEAPIGAVVAVTRLAQWVAYRDADRRWQLGLREAHASGWDVVQPAIGPFTRLRLDWVPHDTGGTLAVHEDTPSGTLSATRLVHPRNR
ncbi:MAG: prepilin-type N-terminal cleavage/methylation domain-containing protein [Gemmatimonadaceae bacterium]|nr:prepilin-type N-terminal cleavage/methylation domain-containing protein [Gemmatimonadaceae bacterium]